MSEERIGRREFVGQVAGTSLGLTVVSTADSVIATEEGNTIMQTDSSNSNQAQNTAAPKPSAASPLIDLHRAVAAVIAGKRIGTPVFVRYTLHGAENSDPLVTKLAQVTGTVQEWFAQPLGRLYAVGNADMGQVSLTLRFTSGATGLISYARCHPNAGGADILLLGNHGAVYHGAGSSRLWQEPYVADLPPADPGILDMIRRALTSKQPISVDAGGRP